MEDRLVPSGRPLPLPVIYAGAGIGMSPDVKAINAETGATNFERTAFESSFKGGVRVAVGDFTRDGFPDVVVAAGPTGGPHVRILDGKTGNQITGPLGSFWAYDPGFTGGVHVAAADVDGDRTPDVITAAGVGGGPNVKVFSGATGMVLADFMAFDTDFSGGITVAAADLTGDGKSEVAVGAGRGGGPRVKVYDPLTATPIAGPLGSFFAFEPNFNGGVFVGADALAGDVDADGTPDLAVGTGPETTARVKVFSGKTGEVLRDLTPFGPDNSNGARPALAYVTNDSYADVVVGSGPGGPATIHVFDGHTGAQLPAPIGEYQPFGPAALGGVFVAASNDPQMTMIGTYDIEYTVGVSTGDVKVADFWEIDETPTASDHTVDIDWGDGTTSQGYTVMTGFDGIDQSTYDVYGEHTYNDFGPHEVTVTITHIEGGFIDGMLTASALPPTIVLSEQPFIPVNANDDNNSRWQESAFQAPMVGLPLMRDLNLSPMRDLSAWDGTGNPPPGPAISDPDLKQMTATVTNGEPLGQINVEVTYSDATKGGRIRLWTDQTKTTEIASGGFLPGWPTANFYVEGTETSLSLKDITVRATYQTGTVAVTDSKQLTVTPVIDEFSVNPKAPDPQTTFFRSAPPPGGGGGKILGLNSGRQNADGATAGSGEQGATFTADLMRTGVGGKGMFIQNVVDLSTTAASMIELSNGAKANWQLPQGTNFPISDSPSDQSVPFYIPTEDIAPISQDRHNFKAVDSPFLAITEQQLGLETIVRMDATFKARLYLTWRFSDETVYTLAATNWQVVFKASMVNGALKIDQTSIVSANSNPKYEVTHATPGAYWGPVYNTTIQVVTLP